MTWSLIALVRGPIKRKSSVSIQVTDDINDD